MDFESVDQLVESFEEKIMTFNLALELQNSSETNAKKHQNTIDDIAGDLEMLKNVFTEIKQEITKSKQHLQQSREMENRATELNAQLVHILNNLPENLPKQKQNDIKRDKIEDIPKPEVEKSRKSLEPLNKQEFDAIPRHIKGRLSHQTLNEAILDFNRAIEKKYHLINKPLSKVGHFELSLYKLHKQQETKETKGTRFCSRDDLRKFNSFKFDNTTKSILNSLSNSKRIRFLFGAGTAFYAIS